MRTCLIAVVGSLLGASTLAAADHRRPSTRTCSRFSRPIVRAAIGPAKWRRCRCSPTSRRGHGRAASRPQSRAGRCRHGLPIRLSATSPTSAGSSIARSRRSTRGPMRGAPAGNEADAPPALTFNSGWNIKPDIIVEMPKAFELPARGTINYKYILVKTNFPEDMWITGRGDAPGRSRRCSTTARCGCGLPDRSGWRTRSPVKRTSPKAIATSSAATPSRKGTTSSGSSIPASARSRSTSKARPSSCPKGSDLVFELHYTTSGKPASDVSKLGLVLAKAAPQKRYFFHAGPTALNLAIPPGEGSAEVVSEITFGEDAQLVYAQPHMHLRGKDFELRVVTPEKRAADRAQGQLQLRVADGLPVRRADRAAEGFEAAAHHPLRQLHRQSLQPRPDEEGRVGTPELG